jgi:hypothetical protein
MSRETRPILVLLAVGWVAISMTWHWFRSRFLLKQWAKANGFELVKMSIPWTTPGPFIVSRRQAVYQIRVRDHSGQERDAWAKCGGFWLGFLVDKVEVELGGVYHPKPKKHRNAERQTIKVRVARVINFICKWVGIAALTVFCVFVYWWAKWHH